MSGIKMKRKVVLTITEDDTDADGVKVEFEFFPDVGGVGTHPGLSAAGSALLKLLGNRFEIQGKAAEE